MVKIKTNTDKSDFSDTVAITRMKENYHRMKESYKKSYLKQKNRSSKTTENYNIIRYIRKCV